MKLEFIPIKGQKFDIGRTINLSKCNCEKCDFMNCPKHNYCVQMKRKIPGFNEFWECWGKDIIEINKLNVIDTNFPKAVHLYLTYNLITEMMECISFPKGTYWGVEGNLDWRENKDIGDNRYKSITLIKFNRKHQEVTIGEINVNDGYIFDYNLIAAQEKLADKISDFIKKIIAAVVNYYSQENQDSLVGWLSPEGRHYKCKSGQHIQLADRLGQPEFKLENNGWIKLAFSDTDMPWLGTRNPTAEQRNWLSLHGYEVAL